jgi:Family of unknown function (DUF6504)
VVRRYDDTIDVRLTQVMEHGGTSGSPGPAATAPGGQPRQQPTAFVWRGRLYVVRAVQTRWYERRAWWQEAAAAALLGLRGDEHGQQGEGRSETAAGAADVPGEAGYLDGETEVWRVEAAAGRSSPVGVFDLARAVPALPAEPALSALPGAAPTGWRLTRVAD